MLRKRKKTVRANEFILEDDQGNARAHFTVADDGCALVKFAEADGRTRLFLGTAADGTPRVCLSYADGKGSIQLEASDPLNCAAVTLTGPAGRTQLVLGISPTGQPAIAIMGKNGKLMSPVHPHRPENGGEEGDAGFDWDQLLRD